VSVLENQVTVDRAAGGAVLSIGGVTAGPGDQWFQYVNGVQSASQNTPEPVTPGDRVWWDLHAADAAATVPAVVGSFPEPFLDGIDGKRLPVTLDCAADAQQACRRVAAAMTAAGIPVALQGIGTGSGQDTLGVVVGRWSDLRGQLDAALIERGPRASGVYATFSSDGSSLQLLDEHGHVVRSLGSGAGLVAATRDSQSQPTWLITGTDRAGVMAAARALTVRRLHLHFAVAVDGNGDIPVPVSSGG
jgi:hypothetical protein